VALDRGATTIYALDVAYTGGVFGPAKDILSILLRVMNIMLYQDLQGELDYAAQQPGVTVHHIVIKGVSQADDFNFDHGAEMVEVGYKRVKEYLAGLSADMPVPAVPEPEPLAPPPPGARLWIPPSKRRQP
jgi:hypothetical protein